MQLKTLLDAHQGIHDRIVANGGPQGGDADQIRNDLKAHLHLFIQEVGPKGIGDLMHILHEAIVQLYHGSTDHPKAGQYKYELTPEQVIDIADSSGSFVGEADEIFPAWLKHNLPALLKDAFGNPTVFVGGTVGPEQPELPFESPTESAEGGNDDEPEEPEAA